MSVNLVKLTFTKPIPAGAKIVTKDGKRFASFQKKPGANAIVFEKKKPAQPIVAPLTESGDRIRVESKCWYAEWWDDNGKRYRRKLCINREASQVMLGDLVAELDRQRAGITDPFETHRKRPIGEHVADFHRYLVAKGRTPKHAAKTLAQIQLVVRGCEFAFLSDLSASRVQEFLGELRADKKPRRMPEGNEEWIAAEEAAKLLGVSRTFLSRQVERYQIARKFGKSLKANGDREAKGESFESRKSYLRRDGVAALLARSVKGKSIATVNHYVVAIKSFAHWCVKDRRIADNPLGHLSGGNAETDRRHERRALDTEEMRALFLATKESDKTLRGLTGQDRLMVYSLAASTGLRAGELATLTPSSFDFDVKLPAVRIDAENSKNGKNAELPLHPDLVAPFREYLAGREAYAVVWPGTWWEKAAAMLRRDLEAAGIAYRDAEGRVVDFHAMGRVSFITALAKSGVHPRTAQELARHSDINLTMGTYSKLTVRDLSAAVGNLPSVLPSAPIAEELKATGTEKSLAVACRYSDKKARKGATSDEITPSEGQGYECTQTAEQAGKTQGLRHVQEIGPARIRTENQGIMSHPVLPFLPRPGKESINSDNLLGDSLAATADLPTEIDTLINAWPLLPADARRAILDIVSAHQPELIPICKPPLR